MLTTKLIPQKKALEVITSGNATFTFKSLKTQTRFTYNVILNKKDHFSVRLLTGPDNTRNYTEIFVINVVNGLPMLTRTVDYRSRLKVSDNATSVIAFKFMFGKFLKGQEVLKLEIWNEGKCCRCGRKLTDPASVELGIGPECITKQSLYNF